MGKRSRQEPVADAYPVVIRRGWLHLADGDVLRVRELLGPCVQKWIGTHPDTGIWGGWAPVFVCELGLIEWDGGE